MPTSQPDYVTEFYWDQFLDQYVVRITATVPPEERECIVPPEERLLVVEPPGE